MSTVHPPRAAVREAVARALAEDIGALGDLTASLIPVHQRATGAIVAREEGVLAGCAAATEVFHQVDPALEVRWQADDGHEVGPGQTLAHVEGPLASMLTAERTALNFLQHLSGVASTTRHWVRATQGKARIWDTRKTTPGLRALEKAAVRAGGGANHRGSLSDFVMVKDNHLTGITIEEAVDRARLHWPGRTVEVECDTHDQVKQAVEAGADVVLLDNMSPQEVSACVSTIHGRCLVEVSGGVTMETLGQYLDLGVDLISAGSITNSAPVLDIGLDIEIAGRA
ncbi:MAG: carboxylating nicotinate-nucleotide diphosphorylase [Actinobacteria bacterium]|nr:MAG: carboxylating nicotinate-nucleotide diphosphorylase [Actinomycetota bacterium]